MKIYRITPYGVRVARSIRAPDSLKWRIIRFMDKTYQSTDEQISESCAMSIGEVHSIAGQLKQGRIIEEV